jgi:hypothetical protein
MAVFSLWGFDGSAWSVVAAPMRLANADGQLDALAMAVRIGLPLLKSG